ncbi:MAG: hypothetical protein ABI651_06375 [Verrucomicrobiota bacterium]
MTYFLFSQTERLSHIVQRISGEASLTTIRKGCSVPSEKQVDAESKLNSGFQPGSGGNYQWLGLTD